MELKKVLTVVVKYVFLYLQLQVIPSQGLTLCFPAQKMSKRNPSAWRNAERLHKLSLAKRTTRG